MRVVGKLNCMHVLAAATLTWIGCHPNRVAGFSLNADHGAAAVARRLRQANPGEIVIAHMNRPASRTAKGVVAALPDPLGCGLTFVRLSQAAGVLPARDGKQTL